MMFDPPDFPYKDLSETLREYGTDDLLFQTIPNSTFTQLPEQRNNIEEELLAFNQTYSSTPYNSQQIIQNNNELINSQSNTTELLIIQSDNLLNFEPTLLDDTIVDQFLLPVQVSKDDKQGAENLGPDLLALQSCVLCHEIFTSDADLLDHTILIHASESIEPSENNVVIPIATQSGNMYSHANAKESTSNLMDMETLWMVCRICERVLSTALEVEPTEKMCCTDENGKGIVATQKLSTMYVCDLCSGLFANGDALDRHKQFCNNQSESYYTNDQTPQNVPQESFNCEYCSFKPKTVEELKDHVIACRRPIQRKYDKRSYNGNTNNKMWNCGSCNQLFATARDLYRHKRGEDRAEGAPLTAYVCEECDKVLGSMCALHTHRKMHKVSKPGYPCQVCGRRFNQSGHLAIHMRMHTGERPYPCDLCPKAFKVKVERDDHRRTHTGERPFACNVCPKTFTAAARLREHARIHTDQRPYRCDICGAAFRRPYARTVHTLIHTGEKPHECDVCGTAFRRSGDMWKHKRTIHCSQVGVDERSS